MGGRHMGKLVVFSCAISMIFVGLVYGGNCADMYKECNFGDSQQSAGICLYQCPE